jgi:starch phosphorylase
MRGESRSALVTYARERLARQLGTEACSRSEIEGAREVLEPDVLTLGFARRFAEYKRPNLLLHDPERLARLLTNRRCPVQLIIAGKAHPADRRGQLMVTEWVRFIRERPEIRQRAVFLSDYDVLLSEYLVQGVDVWLNTPRRPWEASGTSGMKVLVNGGLNLSVLDGWWAEAFSPEVGWSLGDGESDDATDAETLYTLLEREVIPGFYARDVEGLPREWLRKVRCSMALAPAYSANRSVREYTERHYLPAALAYRARAEAGGSGGAAIAAWQARLALHWDNLYFGLFDVETVDGVHHFAVQIYLDGLGPDDVAVELYAEGEDGGSFGMAMSAPLEGSFNGHLYRASIPARLPATCYTARAIPRHPGAMVPLEASQILWCDAPATG